MSVGGVVAEVVPVAADRVWVGTIERYEFTRNLSPAQLAKRVVGVYCDPRGENIQVGDALWWQGGWCLYTPRVVPDGRADVRLPKVSGSGVRRPEAR